MKFDIIVVGGGHAGVEAVYAASHSGKKTALITINKKNIADMPCNPSIGGTAKGVVVREIDALGGIMGKCCDKSFLQMKMLNSGKGPAVRSLRAQGDKIAYPKEILKTLNNEKNLTIIEDTVENIICDNKKVIGIITKENKNIYCDALILTTGTYLRSVILRGSSKTEGGPHGENNSKFLSNNLKELGFKIQRLKTGTPPRLDKSTIDFTKMHEEKGDKDNWFFSHDDNIPYDSDKQISCHLIYTNSTTHQIIKDNLDKSSMYGGYVEGVGPRYCPSIEDKIVRFKDKERHQLFLEPESIYYDDMYLQGFSTSMPEDIQELMVHSLVGLEHVKILKYAYAIEYDAIDPLQLKPTLETKIIENLFTAGQINGTSGYEEAAGQGIIAGINAVSKLNKEEPLILKRNESYIGVLIDDLINKGATEPYRLLTSRAEFRLLLRHDNADLRLRKYGYEHHLINSKQYDALMKKENDITSLLIYLKNNKLNEKATINEIEFIKGTSLESIIKRTDISINDIVKFLDKEYSKEVLEQVEIELKYEGYIKKEQQEADKLIVLESKKIPLDINYDNVKNLASEARQKLNKVRPLTIAQATRISGVNPADISVLAVYLKKEYPNE